MSFSLGWFSSYLLSVGDCAPELLDAPKGPRIEEGTQTSIGAERGEAAAEPGISLRTPRSDP